MGISQDTNRPAGAPAADQGVRPTLRGKTARPPAAFMVPLSVTTQ
jgi:hypothetical protein